MTAAMAPTLEREAVRIRYATVRAALDRDESFGFALARFTLEDGDTAWNPASPPGGAQIVGPCVVTYERRAGRTTARTT